MLSLTSFIMVYCNVTATAPRGYASDEDDKLVDDNAVAEVDEYHDFDDDIDIE